MFYCYLNTCTQLISLNHTVCASVCSLQCRAVALAGADGPAARASFHTLLCHMQAFKLNNF